MRPVSAEFEINQPFGSMRTAGVVGNINASPDTVEYWVGRYGNYQADGHAGADFLCPEGTPVHAIAAGTVLWADWGTNLPGDDSDWGYRQRWYLYKGFPGIVTVIQHDGWIGVYAHLSQAWLNPDDRVTEGQQIGLSGGTGGVDPHLHVEALIDLNYTTGNGLIYGRVNPELLFGSQGIAAMGGAITPITEDEGFLMALTEDEQRRVLAAADMALDTPGRPNPARLLNSVDGGYIVALLEGVSGKVGNTLNKVDGGYIVGLVSALKPGSQDAGAIADAVVNAVGKDIAAEVVAKLGEKLGGK